MRLAVAVAVGFDRVEGVVECYFAKGLTWRPVAVM